MRQRDEHGLVRLDWRPHANFKSGLPLSLYQLNLALQKHSWCQQLTHLVLKQRFRGIMLTCKEWASNFMFSYLSEETKLLRTNEM